MPTISQILLTQAIRCDNGSCYERIAIGTDLVLGVWRSSPNNPHPHAVFIF